MQKNRHHNKCKNKDTNDCVLWSACNDCYYYKEELRCPFCARIILKKWLFKNGCILCQQKGVKNE